ncbi:MAG TPA: hypothetical protein VNQ56_03215 [Pseudolabrys sp.]|nr:hypothetical protein [Pseudolabrys sp.]
MRPLILLAAMLLAACSTYPEEPTRAELDAIRKAQNIFPANYKADVIAFLRNYLNDPTGIRGAAISTPELKTLPTGERYIACLRYDAKKASGEYAGLKTVLVVFISGRLDRFVDSPPGRDTQDENATARRAEVREACKDVSFAPFPELQFLKR